MWTISLEICFRGFQGCTTSSSWAETLIKLAVPTSLMSLGWNEPIWRQILTKPAEKSQKKEIIMWMCIKTIRRISELNFTVQQTALSYETNLEKLVDSAGLNKKWIPHWNIAKRNHHHHQQHHHHHHHRKLNGALISELGLLCSYCF